MYKYALALVMLIVGGMGGIWVIWSIDSPTTLMRTGVSICVLGLVMSLAFCIWLRRKGY